MKEVLCLILGGGRGARLYPLTKERSKPAVPFAGKYRLVDIPISNFLNSGFNQIYVLTQFQAGSLSQHITRTYRFDATSQGFVDIRAAEQSTESADWFQGTADAVRRTLKYFLYDSGIKYVLVLSGDQLYKMDFRGLLDFHNKRGSQITIACNPVTADKIKDYGIMCVDRKGRINNFVEKPQDEDTVRRMSVKIDKDRFYLASMGIYLFDKEILAGILKDNQKADFGHEVIPDSFAHKVSHAYVHKGYWRDIGTIKAFYEENLNFTEDLPSLDLFDENWQIFTRPRYLPPAKIEDSRFNKAVISEGSILYKCSLNHSVIGLRSRIGESAQIEDAIIMGADFYQTIDEIERDKSSGLPPVGIGKDCVVRKAIIDKNVRMGEGVKIINHKGLETFESELYSIKDSIVIIPKNTTLAPGTII